MSLREWLLVLLYLAWMPAIVMLFLFAYILMIEAG